MSALLGVLAAVYGTSLTIAAGGGVLLAFSPTFRRLVIGDMPHI
jgi:hypothetical protein